MKVTLVHLHWSKTHHHDSTRSGAGQVLPPPLSPTLPPRPLRCRGNRSLPTPTPGCNTGTPSLERPALQAQPILQFRNSPNSISLLRKAAALINDMRRRGRVRRRTEPGVVGGVRRVEAWPLGGVRLAEAGWRTSSGRPAWPSVSSDNQGERRDAVAGRQRQLLHGVARRGAAGWHAEDAVRRRGGWTDAAAARRDTAGGRETMGWRRHLRRARN